MGIEDRQIEPEPLLTVFVIPFSRIHPSINSGHMTVRRHTSKGWRGVRKPSYAIVLHRVMGDSDSAQSQSVWPHCFQSSLPSWLSSWLRSRALGRVSRLECGVLLGQFSSLLADSPALQRFVSQAVRRLVPPSGRGRPHGFFRGWGHHWTAAAQVALKRIIQLVMQLMHI